MAQIEPDRPVSLSLSAGKQGETKKAEPDWLLPCFRTRVGARVALQRCPILRTSIFKSTSSPYSPFNQGTFLLCNSGDISTLH